jgi:hypothetical protein
MNWSHVVFNALWILGCALILAAFSHAHWLAYTQGTRARQLLRAHVFQVPFSIGLFMVSLGLFFLSNGWLERILWAGFAILFAWQAQRVRISSQG